MKNLNIDLYLRTAFRELDQFSIPDIGTFRKIYRSASVSSDMEMVQPPLVAVEFEESVYESLSLTGYLQNIIHFPEGESQQIVMSIRNAMLEDFEKKQRFEIPDIGVLRRKENGQLTFMPADQEKSLFSTDFFGMKPVSLPGSSANVVAMEHQDNLGPMTKMENSKKKTLAGSVGWKPILVVLLFAGLGALLITNGPFITRGEEIAEKQHTAPDSATMGTQVQVPAESPSGDALNPSGMTLAPKADSSALAMADEAEKAPPSDANTSKPGQSDAGADVLPPADVPKTSLEAPLADATPAGERSLGEVTRGLTRPEPTDIGVLDTLKKNARISRSASSQPAENVVVEKKVVQPAQKADTYHLIIGSFSSSQAAAELVKEMQAGGMRSTILFPAAGSSQSYRVSVFSSPDKNQVIAYNQMLKNLGKKTGWILATPK